MSAIKAISIKYLNININKTQIRGLELTGVVNINKDFSTEIQHSASRGGKSIVFCITSINPLMHNMGLNRPDSVFIFYIFARN